MTSRAPDGEDLVEATRWESDRRVRERREIDAHRVELVEALDRADARSWRRDVLFAAIGALVGAILSASVVLIAR